MQEMACVLRRMIHGRSCKPLSFDLFDGHVIRVFPYYSICHLPYLNEVILCRTAQYPWVIHIPAEVSYAIRMATMHEQSVDGLVVFSD